VVVTHDEELARAARRVIHMRDGAIVGDEIRTDATRSAGEASVRHSATPVAREGTS